MASTDWFSRWAEYSPDKIAVKEHESGSFFTYTQINDRGNYFTQYLQEKHDLRTGDRVAVLAENCLEYIVLFSVAQKLGITLVPLNFRLMPSELDYIIGNAQPKAIVYEEVFLEKISELNSFKKVDAKFPITELRTGQFPKPPTQFGNQYHEDHPIFILYTSGTTAFPKGALYSHKMLFWNSVNTALRLDITSDDKSLNVAPPFHTGSWNVLQTPFFHHGAYTLLMKKFEPDVVLKALDEEEMTVWWAVPTMLKMMADSPVFDEVKLEKLRYFVVGGEPMPIPLIEKWAEKGVLIRQGYGLTEVGPNVTSLDHTDAIRKKGSIGKPNFYIQTKIIDENGKESDSGELLLKGPNVTPGYWQNEEATSNAIKDGWFHTGDVVRRDEDGYFYIIDRIKNMYISGGENVYPAEVEHCLRSHQTIEEAAIIGVPDKKWGETGKAFIVRASGALSAEEVIVYCKSKLAGYKVPRQIEFLDALPKNDSGKIDRKALM